MRTILNISGYNGKSENNICRLVKGMFFDFDVDIVSPILAHKPSIDYPNLLDTMKSIQGPVVITAKSMGAFYAGLLNSSCKAPVICFNPSFNPLKNLSFSDEDARVLSGNDYAGFVLGQSMTCCMSTGDMRIDHLEQIKKYAFLAKSYNVLIGGYNHDFDGIEEDEYLTHLTKHTIEYYFAKIDPLCRQ